MMMAAKTIIRRYSDGSNDSLTLNLSYESSSFDESIDETIPLGTRPYLFEPEVSSNEEMTASSMSSPQKSEMDDEERRENSECDESNSSVNLTPDGSSSFEDFDSMIPLGSKPYLFEPEVSSDEESTTSKKSTHEMDDKERQGNNDWRMQQMGYRQLARWCWEWLGKHVRVSLPACAVHKIQMTFPEEKGPDQ